MDGADGEARTGNSVGSAQVDCTADRRKSFIRDLYLVTSLVLKIPILRMPFLFNPELPS
jgi:hypothetical protein